jgi:hypothetical protein
MWVWKIGLGIGPSIRHRVEGVVSGMVFNAQATRCYE